eukprot:jgi/Astpho2/88/Aster-x0891
MVTAAGKDALAIVRAPKGTSNAEARQAGVKPGYVNNRLIYLSRYLKNIAASGLSGHDKILAAHYLFSKHYPIVVDAKAQRSADLEAGRHAKGVGDKKHNEFSAHIVQEHDSVTKGMRGPNDMRNISVLRREPQSTVEVRVYTIHDSKKGGQQVRHHQSAEMLVCLREDYNFQLPRVWFEKWQDDLIEYDRDSRWDLVKTYVGDPFEPIETLAMSLFPKPVYIRLHKAVDIVESTYDPARVRNGRKRNSGAINSKATLNIVNPDATTFADLLSDPVRQELAKHLLTEQDACAWDVTLLHLSKNLKVHKSEVVRMMAAARERLPESYNPQWVVLNGSLAYPVKPGVNFDAFHHGALMESLTDMTPVWEAFHLEVLVVDVLMEPRFHLLARGADHSKPPMMVLMQKDEHLRFITLTNAQIGQLYERDEEGKYKRRSPCFGKPSDKWGFFTPRAIDKHPIVESVEDIMALALTLSETNPFISAYTKEPSAKKLFFAAWQHHQPENLDGLCKRIRFKYDKGVIIVQSFPRNPTDKDFTFPSNEELQAALEWQRRIHTELFQIKHMSKYPHVIKHLRKFAKQAYNRRFAGVEVGTPAEGVDRVKQYTTQLVNLKYLPVMSHLDTWEEVSDDYELPNKMEIEDYTLYAVTARPPEDGEIDVYLDRECDICVGMSLKEFPRERFRIEAQLRPSMLIPNPMINTIKELYTEETRLSLDITKNLPNINIGSLGKHTNRTHHTHTFVDKEEARYMRAFLEKQTEVRVLSPPDGLEFEELYWLEQAFENPLVEGFYLIKFFLLDRARADMQRMIRDAQKRGCDVMGISTDLLSLKLPEGSSVQKVFSDILAPAKTTPKKEFPHLGKVRHEKTHTVIQKVVHGFQKQDNFTFTLHDKTKWVWNFSPKPKVKSAKPEGIDEYDRKAMADAAFKPLNGLVRRLMWKSPIPGAGKTDCAMEVQKVLRAEGKTVINVVPYHATRSMLAEKGAPPGNTVTSHRFFNVAATDRDKGCGIMDVSEVANVHFEEVFLLTDAMAARIAKFANDNPFVMVTCTGDPLQIPAIGDPFAAYGNFPNKLDARVQRFESIFQNVIELEHPKFLVDKDSKFMETLRDVKRMLFEESHECPDHEHVKNVANRFFGRPIADPFAQPLTEAQKEELRQVYHVTQHNITKNRINSQLSHKFRKKGSTYGKVKVEVGVRLRVAKPFKTKVADERKRVEFQQSDLWDVTAVAGQATDASGSWSLQNVYTGEQVQLSKEKFTLEDFWKSFDLTFAGTVFISQGARAAPGQKVIAYDVGSPFMDKFCFWVMFTRCRDMDNFHYVSDNGKAIGNVKKAVLRQIASHPATKGAKAGDLNATTAEVINKLKQYNFRCPGIKGTPCNRDLFDENGTLCCDMDREDANLGLTPENTFPRCSYCNRDVKRSDDHVREDPEGIDLSRKRRHNKGKVPESSDDEL